MKEVQRDRSWGWVHVYVCGGGGGEGELGKVNRYIINFSLIYVVANTNITVRMPPIWLLKSYRM